jgi:hypothetical protein
MKVKDFVEQHKHINYCEAIIFPNGDIEYANPSHTEKLISITNEPKEELDRKIPIDAGPVAWLVDYTGCVVLWYDFCYLPEQFTSAQAFTIAELLKAKIVHNPYIGHQLKEKAIIERNNLYRETGKFKEIEKKEIPFYLEK